MTILCSRLMFVDKLQTLNLTALRSSGQTTTSVTSTTTMHGSRETTLTLPAWGGILTQVSGVVSAVGSQSSSPSPWLRFSNLTGDSASGSNPWSTNVNKAMINMASRLQGRMSMRIHIHNGSMADLEDLTAQKEEFGTECLIVFVSDMSHLLLLVGWA